MEEPTEEEEEALKRSVQYSVGELCRAEEQQDGVEMSADAVTALAELTYHYATSSLANDLVAFSAHRGSKMIHVDDVKLVARKDPNKLLPALEAFCAKHCGGGKSCATSSSKLKDKQKKLKLKSKSNATTAYVKRSAKKGGDDSSMLNAMNIEQRRDHFLKEAESSSDDDDEMLMTDAKLPASASARTASAVGGKMSTERFHLQIFSSGSSSSSGSDSSVETGGDSRCNVSIAKQTDANVGASRSVAFGKNENIWSNLSQSDHEEERTKKSTDVSVVAIDLSDD